LTYTERKVFIWPVLELNLLIEIYLKEKISIQSILGLQWVNSFN